MTHTPDSGGPAFPTPQDEFGKHSPSMSLRDYFAGQALIGLVHPGWEADPIKAPAKAYEVADAMLEARK